MRKTVAVIGAGSSGLTAIKACKEEGLDVVCFEKTNRVGGLWHYDGDKSEEVTVMKSTVINTHKEMSAFSDFPPPSHLPNYMHNSQILQYFLMYAENFGLLPHIRYNHEVISISKSDDYEETGRWKIVLKVLPDGKEFEQIFDGVMLCNGHHARPKIPQLPGQSDFLGRVMHSQSMKVADDFKELNVLVVGIGNSGVDAAVELSNVAKQVYLSTRRGTWIFTRSGPFGLPYDALVSNRFLTFIYKLLGWRISSWLFENFFLENKLDHSLYGLKPKHRALSQHPTINDILPTKILAGRINIKGDIETFAKNGVIFRGENTVTPVDAVIFATGYNIQFPFMKESILNSTNNKVELYKLTFPPDLTHPTLAVIGLIQPVGAIFPIAEAQSRWFAQLMNEKITLPDYKTMKNEISCRRKAMEERYVESTRHTIQVDFIDFMDDITQEFGAAPNMWNLFLNDPKLFFACLVGPGLPYQYRLNGPHSWPKARETILKFPSRVTKPLSNEICHSRYSFLSPFRLINILPAWVIIIVVSLIFKLFLF
ncbi:flavin-containing monooxygenase 5-like [Argiope bruennichi]|uniref:Flavin-containing monooxygenase n=1 Tax=Argiope bruennichi TaxID=94029 RepID=A0A8T0FHH7_ARGBR|nr:flavin-containing monooxygenase 5-like [Argiope bruennichi]KAF8789862.1 Dimethylaniline monooxygenase like protein [Argiope bruennichi]